ncbi:MAG: protein-L-isoaspartate O-methyltransferase [Steroidobacteraceae bacterium]
MNLDHQTAREHMISRQLRTWSVLDERVLNAVRNTPRENFVPSSYRELAFADDTLPLQHGQIMLSPKLEARILQIMAIGPHDQTLVIGAANGYLAACAAQLAGKVRVTEAHSDLAEQARRNLQGTACNNIYVDNVDALQLNLDKAYEAIIITGSLPRVPAALEQALTIGGRMFVVIGTAPIMEALKITRTNDHIWQRESLFETVLPSLSGATKLSSFVF